MRRHVGGIALPARAPFLPVARGGGGASGAGGGPLPASAPDEKRAPVGVSVAERCGAESGPGGPDRLGEACWFSARAGTQVAPALKMSLRWKRLLAKRWDLLLQGQRRKAQESGYFWQPRPASSCGTQLPSLERRGLG